MLENEDEKDVGVLTMAADPASANLCSSSSAVKVGRGGNSHAAEIIVDGSTELTES